MTWDDDIEYMDFGSEPWDMDFGERINYGPLGTAVGMIRTFRLY